MLTFLKKIKSVCSELEVLWVKTVLCLPQGSQWIPGSVQQNVWDNLDSSDATGFQMAVRRRRMCAGTWVSAASFFVANWGENVFQVWWS